jgi:hypothetical protein
VNPALFIDDAALSPDRLASVDRHVKTGCGFDAPDEERGWLYINALWAVLKKPLALRIAVNNCAE